MSKKGRHLDLSSSAANSQKRASESGGAAGKFLGVHFACCDVYTRVYLNRDQTAYEGRCPRCGKLVRMQVGEGGTDARFFTAH